MFRVSPKLESLFETPIPRELWHYTSVGAFAKILSSGKFWATEARFTSDPTEYVFLRKVVTEFLNSLEPRIVSVGLDVNVLLELLKIHYEKGVLSPGFADVFIASFSTAEDLRSQWIAYGGEAYRGVSIAFDLGHLRPASELDTSVTLAPCVYGKEKQEELILEPLNRFIEPLEDLQKERERNYAIKKTWPIVQSIWPDAGEPPYAITRAAEIRDLLVQGTKNMSRDLFVLASQFKNPKFEEEHEWRLVLPRNKKKDSARLPIKIRKDCWNSVQVEIPYVELELQAADADRLPIVRVIVGPRCDAAPVEAILKRHGYDVPITPSQVPVR
jgi:hypothetical protein